MLFESSSISCPYKTKSNREVCSNINDVDILCAQGHDISWTLFLFSSVTFRGLYSVKFKFSPLFSQLWISFEIFKSWIFYF